MPRTRYEYLLRFPALFDASLPELGPALTLHEPSLLDVRSLAELVHDAYQGTIDYDGESLQQAEDEVASYFSRKDSLPMLTLSSVALSGGKIASACLVSKLEKRGEPLITYLMTLTELKGKGLARYLAASSARKVEQSGYRGLRAFITEGNAASESVVAALGFVRLGPV